jgi:membrane-associated phospholipid phosphatase
VYILKNNLPEPGPLPPAGTRASYWAAHQRRPIFLLLLGIGLGLAFALLPEAARTSFLNAIATQRALVSLLSLFALLALSLIWSSGQRFDMYIFTLLNQRGYPAWLDRLMWLATQLGNMLVAFMLAGLFYLLNFHLLAVEIIIGTLSLWLLVELIKAISDRDRPFLTYEKARIIGWREKGNSFPSGHTTQIFFLVTLFIHRFQLEIGVSVVLYAVAALVGFTRIYLGAHYPRDVIAGLVLGSSWGIMAMLVDSYWLLIHF